MDYKPLSRIFQDVGQAIRAGDPRLACIDVSKPGFLARRDLPPVELPIQRVPQEVAISRKETTSTHLSLEAEINQFHLEEEGEVLERPVELSNSEVDFDRFLAAQSPKLVVARVDTSFEEEVDMALNSRRGLRDLVAGRKGGPSKDVPKTQLPPNHTLPSLPSPFGLQLDLNLQKRKRKGREIEEGEFAPSKDPK